MTAAEIRRRFIAFFTERGHRAVPSAPVVPADDPTLMFTNAGMNQFKDVFLATGSRAYSRAVNSQKCIRVSGKHNDLEVVGRSHTHHTFFEMLGNWSFGDYFKAEAIAWAFELLTCEFGIPADRLWATVFRGDPTLGLEADTEAEALWPEKTDLPPDRVLRCGAKDNFWEMGATGPCGPCSEIHVDLGADRCNGSPHAGSACAVNVDGCRRFVELWNLVFIQYSRDEAGKLSDLPARHVDTGMGLERLTAVLQDKPSNYDTDLFAPLIARIAERTGHRYTGQLDHDADNAFRVIADHVRALTFAITDGVMPSNEGRGYVMRRLLRRAARFGRQHLGQNEPFIYGLVPTLIAEMGDAFPELRKVPDRVVEVIHDEERSFARTLDRGLRLFNAIASGTLTSKHLPAASRNVSREMSQSFNEQSEVVEIAWPGDPPLSPPNEVEKEYVSRRGFDDLEEGAIEDLKRTPGVFPASVAFKLYDTYGFPIDLTIQMAEERSLRVDVEGFERLMAAARQRARDAAKTGASVTLAVQGGLPACDDLPKYAGPSHSAAVVGWIENNELHTDGQVPSGTQVALLTESTCFYAEQGGQVGDCGRITAGNGEFEVSTTQRHGDAVVHVGSLIGGTLEVGQVADLTVDPSRDDTRRNHTATHLMHWALCEVLGEHSDQKGSLVAPDRLRFDFTHNKPVTAEQLAEIERRVNERIYADLPIETQEMATEEAGKLPGVRQLFGEKYGERVRVVTIGDGFSREFCGGTHLTRTGQTGFFKIVAEEGVSKGVRRITAVTGPGAVAHVQRLDTALHAAAAALKTGPDQVAERIAALQAQLKEQQKKRQREQTADLGTVRKKLLAEAEKIDGHTVIVAECPDVPAEAVRESIDWLRGKAGSAAVLLAAKSDGKVLLVAGMTDDLVEKGVRAGDLIKTVAPLLGGRGGGKPQLAQGSGNNPEALEHALDQARRWIRERLE